MIVITSVFYEIGQLQDEKWNLLDYLTLWNSLDVISLILMLTWVITKYSHLNSNFTGFYIGYTALSVSAIPLSIVILQYVSLNKEVGILIIIITAMFKDVLTFLTVYIFCMLGFAITFQALYYDYGYNYILISMLKLYETTLGNIDLESFIFPSCPPMVDDSNVSTPEW